MNNGILIDTDILVDFLRGNPKAAIFLKAHLKEIVLSAILEMKIIYGKT